jgi:tRNA 5-methylaminomethyl-2-thiouridine biosynthesis bifunctional protein
MSHPQPKKVSIVGAGLAGAACANAFASVGYSVIVYEQAAHTAAGASGVPIGLFAPSISADDAPHSRLLRRGVHVLLQELHRLTDAGLLEDGVDWAMTGVLERCIRSDKKLPSAWLDPVDPVKFQSRSAGKIESIRLAREVPQIFHGAAGWVNPRRLIDAWLAHSNIRLQTLQRVEHPHSLQADLVVIAAGHQTSEVWPTCKTLLQSIRGQIEWGKGVMPTQLQHPINGLGHFIQTPSLWLAGSTFQRDEIDVQARMKDVAKNFEKLATLMPELTDLMLERLRAQSQSWVGVRAAQKNRQPLVQKIESSEHRNLWVCAGLGSRGLSLAALCAQDVLSAALGSSI